MWRLWSDRVGVSVAEGVASRANCRANRQEAETRTSWFAVCRPPRDRASGTSARITSARITIKAARKMPRRQAVAHALLLCASAAGFSMPHAPATRPRAELLTARRHAAAISMVEKIPSPDAGRFPFRSVVLGLLSLQSAIGLTQENELGGLITRFTDATLVTNYFNTFFDSAFLAYGANFLLNQAGYPNPNPNPNPSPNPSPNPNANPNPDPNQLSDLR